MFKEQQYYRVSEVARVTGASNSQIRELIREGCLRSVQFSPRGWHRIPIEDVERLLAEETEAGP